jgi:hypothetical protein
MLSLPGLQNDDIRPEASGQKKTGFAGFLFI